MNTKDTRKQMRAIWVRVLFACLLLVLSGAALLRQQKEHSAVQIIPPTCTDGGYSLYTDERKGSTSVRDVVPPLGHTPGERREVRAGTKIEPAVFSAQCTRCGQNVQTAEYPDVGLPRLSLNGELTGIGKREEVPVTAEFVSETMQFTAYSTVKYQGHSSLQYEKKNYTLKLYRDTEREEKYKLTFSHWNPENKYILKANYQDPSQCRNLAAAVLWAEMVQSRTTVAPLLKKSPNFGAVDGFPTAVYMNDRFHGLYTLNLHKDEDLYAMRDGEHHAVMIVNHTNGDEAMFRADPAFETDTPWEVEFCGTKDSSWARERLCGFVRFVRESDDETFMRELEMHLDLDSAADYLIAMYALGLQEHCAKDLVLITYGENEPWIASMYDMEEAFDGDGPSMRTENGVPAADTGSLLWDRFSRLFPERIAQRYAVLRQTVLKPQAVRERLERIADRIPQDVYRADADRTGGTDFDKTQLTAMAEAAAENIKIMDNLFLNGGKSIE